MSTPDPNEDFVEELRASLTRLLDQRQEVTDLEIADDSGLELATVRAVLEEEAGGSFEVQRGDDDEPWRVRVTTTT
jgi:hypothetical protein